MFCVGMHTRLIMLQSKQIDVTLILHLVPMLCVGIHTRLIMLQSKQIDATLIFGIRQKGEIMAFPLVTVLTAAPGVISAAAKIIRAIREKKKTDNKPDTEKLDELEALIEQQALLLEELAKNNQNLALAVRNNRIITIISLITAIAAAVIAI